MFSIRLNVGFAGGILCVFFFFNDKATNESNTYGHTLPLHDALPNYYGDLTALCSGYFDTHMGPKREAATYRAILTVIGMPGSDVLFLSDIRDRKSTRLTSSP